MQEQSRYAVGLDIGTTRVRCVVGHVDGGGAPTIVGVGEAPNTGMRKGTVVNIVNTAQAIDKALEAAERMSGQPITGATVSINGAHIVGMSSKGVIAIGAGSHEIDQMDIARAEEAATVMQLPANREILQVTPREFILDGQDNIKDPMGMSGVRLEVDAHVITALSPHVKNLVKACEMTQTASRQLVVAGLAAARVALPGQLIENGVVLVDLGGTTTSVVVFEEGDVQHVSILPIGSVNITNDLAIGLKTELAIAEDIKLQFGAAMPRDAKSLAITHNKEKLSFSTADIDMIVEARLEETFELVNKELKSIGRAAKLPGGVVLTGGGANMHGIADYAKKALQLPARVVKIDAFGGVTDNTSHPEFATALGLMVTDLANESGANTSGQNSTGGGMMASLGGLSGGISNLLKRFKS